MPELSEAIMARMKEAFCLFDKDGDGLIPARDFHIVVRSLGVNPSDKELDALLGGFDGTLSFNEFLKKAGERVSNSNPEKELCTAFKAFDRDGNGTISSAELKHVMLNLGERLDATELDEMLKIADKKGSGLINYTEFVQYLLS